VTGFAIPVAHGIGGRSDLALPGWLFSWAAAAVLAISFFALAALWTEPKLETARVRSLFALPRLLDPLCGAIGVAVFFALIWFGFAGEQDSKLNVLPAFVYIFFWSMIPLISAIFGDVFKPFNPWRAIGRCAHLLRARFASGGTATPRFAYPEALGRWPALAGLLAFGWFELVSGELGTRPALLATLALAYLGFQLIGMALFGVERWLDRADAFGTYFGFFARISPLVVQRRRLGLRAPLSGLTEITPLAGTVTFICAMIGITVYDGIERGGVWQSIAGGDPSRLVATLGLAVSVLIVAGFFRLGVLGMEGSHIEKSPRELSELFAPSLVPIALGYLVAHYFSFMVFDGQVLPHLIAHPLGDAGPAKIDYFMSNKSIWWIQVAALLAGHVAGLVVAHDKATAVWGKARAAAQSQTWMLVVMVGFTSLGLWLLSQSG
jgi:hypothetical protein